MTRTFGYRRYSPRESPSTPYEARRAVLRGGQRSLIMTPITKKVSTMIAGTFCYGKQLLKRHYMRSKRQGRLHRPCRSFFISKKPQRAKKRASRTRFRCSTRSDLAEMGECHSCTQHPVLLKVAILYHRKSYMSIVFHSGIYDSIHFQKIFSRCLSQLSGTNDLSEQRSHLVLMISTTILVIEGFDPEAVHLHHAFSRT